MNEEHREHLRKAASSLKLLDIYLLDARFTRPAADLVSTWDGKGVQQGKRGVKFVRADAVHQDRNIPVIEFQVELGYRVVTDAEASEPVVVFEIEARYTVVYECAAEVANDVVSSFAQLNAVHIVWPFWRQHVFDIVQRSRLPHLEVPLLAGIAS
mgnify:CR=1 FL=1